MPIDFDAIAPLPADPLRPIGPSGPARPFEAGPAGSTTGIPTLAAAAALNASASSFRVAPPSLAAAANANKIHTVTTQAQFDALFSKAQSVRAGAPVEAKFLIDRASGEIYFIPPKWQFHYLFFHDVINGSIPDAQFDQMAYNRPDRKFIPGSVTRYDSYVDPVTGKKGKYCFSLWPTDRFDPKVLKETHDALKKSLKVLEPGEDVTFRPGGPIQDRLVAQHATQLKADKVGVTTNLEISAGLKFMALSTGDAFGKLVIVEKGQAAPPLGRGDVALFLGDVPPTAPPVAAVITSQVQTYNSHLGIKYRQDKTPYFYKAFSPTELADLRALNGKPVSVKASGSAATVTAASATEVADYLDRITPKVQTRLAPNLSENRARSFKELTQRARAPNGTWKQDTIAAYGRKTMGIVELMNLKATGKLAVNGPGEPEVVTPQALLGIPANWYTRFMRLAKDANGKTFSERIKTLTGDRRFGDVAWRATELAKLRADITKATMPADLVNDVREQVAKPYLTAMPNADRARFRSSAPVVEDSAGGQLPNMAGAFDSNSARWRPGATKAATLENATAAMVETLRLEYASVWNDRAVSELAFNRVDMDEGSVALALLVTPSEQNERANGVVRVNPDLAGFFSITGETQFGDENLVTNPTSGAVPDTWIDGNYDIFNGQAAQDIEYERLSNLPSTEPGVRKHAYKDEEISSLYKAMKVIREHFAKLEGKAPEKYLDECETKITSDGKVLIKQERPWLD